MRPNIQARCPLCGGVVEVPYIFLGAPTACPACGETVVPEVPVGTAYPRTGYEITFRDFHQLVREKAYRPAIRELLARWYDYELHGKGESSVVRSRSGEAVDLLDLHRRIQKDSSKQHEIYRTAMALWR